MQTAADMRDKQRRSSSLVRHMADNRTSKTTRSHQASTRNKLFELFLNFPLVVGFRFAFWFAYGTAQSGQIKSQFAILNCASNTPDDQVGCLAPPEIAQHHFC